MPVEKKSRRVPCVKIIFSSWPIHNLYTWLCITIVLFSYLTPVNAETIRFQGLDIPDQSGQVMTVLGPINPGDVGHALMHEHLLVDVKLSPDQPDRWKRLGMSPPKSKEEITRWAESFSVKNRTKLLRHFLANKDAYTLDSVEDAIDEVSLYNKLGGKTIVDVTSIGIRVPGHARKLQEIANKTNTNIIMGTGFYRNAWYPKDMDQRTFSDLTQTIVKELVIGVGDHSIKAGIIGEIPVENLIFEPEESDEVRVLRAAARASKLTGAAISLHCNFSQMDILHRALDILEDEGADLRRVIVGHAINFDLESSGVGAFESVLRRGVYLQFDLLGMPHFELYQGSLLVAIKKLIDYGYSKQLLVSQDIFYKMQLTKYGGHGLTYVHSVLVPYLRNKGVKEISIQNILEANPRRVLTFIEPSSL